jgi:hypothetical protein
MIHDCHFWQLRFVREPLHDTCSLGALLLFSDAVACIARHVAKTGARESCRIRANLARFRHVVTI